MIIEPKFRIGDFVWFATYGTTEVREPCPVCFGKQAVTIILGNGEHWIIACDYCAKGYTEPRGFVTVSEYGPRVVGYTVDRVSASATAVEYQSDCQVLDGERTFATRDEAMAKAVEIAASAQAERAKAAEYGARHNAKGKPWSAGYHMREAKNARKRAEHHERMAKQARAEAKSAVLAGAAEGGG